jgi:hypothetical protein
MTISEVIALLPRRPQARTSAPAKAKNEVEGPADRRPGERVKAAMHERGNIEALLGHIRELIVGPTQRLGEARFEELLDILAEQDASNKVKMQALRGEVTENAAGSRRLGELCLAMNDRIGQVDAKVGAGREASKAELEAALMAINEQIEKKCEELEAKTNERIAASARETRREIEALSAALGAHVARTEEMFVQAREVSFASIEQRIAQWRAEIADERRQDMEQMTESLVDIGQRLIHLRREN